LEPGIKLLVELQGCDTRISNIQNKKQEGPTKIQRLEEDFLIFKERLDQELNQIEEFKVKRRQAEQGIDDLETKIDKTNIKLSNIKSNKEYQAALKEIEDLKRNKTVLEDEVIEIMEETQAVKDKSSITKEEKEKFEKKFKKDRNKILKELKALDKEFKGLEEERSLFCRDIDGDLLNRYDSIREHKDGVAVSSVIKGVCQACNLGIPPQKFNELIRGDGMMTCPNCMRIIYWGEDEYFNKDKDVEKA